jgi:hypothetical protein
LLSGAPSDWVLGNLSDEDRGEQNPIDYLPIASTIVAAALTVVLWSHWRRRPEARLAADVALSVRAAQREMREMQRVELMR